MLSAAKRRADRASAAADDEYVCVAFFHNQFLNSVRCFDKSIQSLI